MMTLFRICRGKQTEDEILTLKNDEGALICFQYDEAGKKEVTKKKCQFNSYFISLFVTTLRRSAKYRLLVTTFLLKKFNLKSSSVLRIKMDMYPSRHIIDYRWNDIMLRLCYEKRELSIAMAWLSTLGGAFSALGDLFQDCALVAGRISREQFKLAIRQGDPPTVARCRLFYALSLMQCGDLKRARDLIKGTYQLAITVHTNDNKLRRMCLGIWTKLRHEWNQNHKRDNKRMYQIFNLSIK